MKLRTILELAVTLLKRDYTCYCCSCTYEKGQTTIAALKEFWSYFPGESLLTAAQVCDDCYYAHFSPILKCPKCNVRPRVRRADTSFYVCCPKCGIHGAKLDPEGCDLSQAQAIASWNEFVPVHAAWLKQQNPEAFKNRLLALLPCGDARLHLVGLLLNKPVFIWEPGDVNSEGRMLQVYLQLDGRLLEGEDLSDEAFDMLANLLIEGRQEALSANPSD